MYLEGSDGGLINLNTSLKCRHYCNTLRALRAMLLGCFPSSNTDINRIIRPTTGIITFTTWTRELEITQRMDNMEISVVFKLRIRTLGEREGNIFSIPRIF
jgi:hypothetical protein